MSDIQEINPNLEPMWTANKVAEYLSLNRVTIYNWIAKGRIKYAKIGNRVRIPKSEVERIVGDIKANIIS